MKSPVAFVKASDWTGPLLRLGRWAVDLAYPPVCLACQAPVADADALCANCFSALRPITRPFCPRLGVPFAVSLGPDAHSAEAMADPPPFGRSRSALVYNDVARRIVSRLKYGDRPEFAGFCARLMRQAGAEFWPEGPVLVPVPLNPMRQWQRRYNQSLELARILGRLTGAPVLPGIVSRPRPTRRQVGLSRASRQRNVAGAFAVADDIVRRLDGRGVIIIDDVITTGATVKALTLALNRAGVGKVDVLSFARVVVGDETPI